MQRCPQREDDVKAQEDTAVYTPRQGPGVDCRSASGASPADTLISILH